MAKSAFKVVQSTARIFRIMTYVGREGGRRKGDVEVADDAGVVRGDGVRHRGRLHKVVVRCVQQPVQDVSFVISGLTDSLGQIKSGHGIHYSGSSWVQGVVVMHVEVAKDAGGAM